MAEASSELHALRHSTAHVMADAVLSLFPEAKIAIGPAIEDGFYYDFELPRSLTPDDLDEIENKMREIVSSKYDFEKKVITRSEAKKMFKDQPYKLELIDGLSRDEEISVYVHNSFKDLCRGPHIKNTSLIHPKAFKLLTVAGAYWRGDEKRTMLQRIYGTVWNSPKELREYLEKRKEIERRDHRRLGKELDLYSTHEEAGAGLIYWHPKGARIRHLIEDFWKNEHFKNGYELIYTPHIGKAWLWQTSGHLGFYKENMYAAMEIDNADYYIKPMNCPFHILIYKSALRSYRELPLRWAELGTVYRYERSGVLHGLLRVRGFTQDDAHIICTPDQVEEEIERVLKFSLAIWKTFQFTEIKAYLATKPEKSVGEDADWDKAISSLQKAVASQNLPYVLDEGGGAFYGPKIDLKVKDALGREWQMSTIQFDFNMPERFNMTFVDSDGREKRPFMIHRALLGSFERFFGVLIEHFAGAFPVWLAPVQAVVIPVALPFTEYAQEVLKYLRQAEIRVISDESDERMNAKIRKAQQQKIPYMLIVGENEQAARTVSIRTRTGEKMNNLALTDCVELIKQKVQEKSLI
ncbi:MAG: threonine--tRNA ligase [Spirochaetales bacterium]|nr:threonine--tRNA ligase [Spirochaetales bacterium]